MLGLALSLCFASPGAGWLPWPLLGTVARLAVAALAGWLALRWTGELSHVFRRKASGSSPLASSMWPPSRVAPGSVR
jgi:hypothetical protein